MPIIKNYGLRWIRDKVQWGTRGVAGCLKGTPATARTAREVDFKDQIGVYVLFEPGFIPVYIGQAGFGAATLFTRLRNHRNDHLRDRWSHFSWFGFRAVNGNGSLSAKNSPESSTSLRYIDALDEIEGILIQVLEPRLNKQGAKWQQTADEYVQDGRPAEADRIEEINMRLSEIEGLIKRLAGRE